MATHQETSEKSKKIEKINLNIIIFLFSVISFYTSYTGLLKLSGVSEYNYIFKAFMGVLVFALQYTLVFSIKHFYFKDIFKANSVKPIYLLTVYLITMILSVTFSFSYWYEEFSAESYSKRSSELQLNKVRNNLMVAKSSLVHVSSNLISLSNYSDTASTRERLHGRTCDRNIGAGEGSFTWLRADESRLTKDYSVGIQKLNTVLAKEIEGVTVFLQDFDPKGDVLGFNQKVNEQIQQINIKIFNNQILKDLELMLVRRSGKNRQQITVVNKKTGSSSVKSCVDEEFTANANSVIHKLRALNTIETVAFFDMNDTQKLFGRTAGVLIALVDPSQTIVKSDEMKNPDDITTDDISAVSAGFVIDLLIMLLALYGKEPKEEVVSYDTVKKILDGSYLNSILSQLKPYLAEMSSYYLIAIPSNVEDDEIEKMEHLMVYMQQQKFAKLYTNDIKASRLNKYFSQNLKSDYSDKTFRVYRMENEKFQLFISQNIKKGVHNV